MGGRADDLLWRRHHRAGGRLRFREGKAGLMASYDVAVIGLGAMGSAALYAAAGRGLHAIGFDRYQPAHRRSSSFGESRVIRLAYFEHPSYVPLLREAYERWRALEAA